MKQRIIYRIETMGIILFTLFFLQSPPLLNAAAQLKDLQQFKQLERLFNKDKSQVRLIAILSPT